MMKNTVLAITILSILNAMPQVATAQEVGAKWVIPPVMEVDGLNISPRSSDALFEVKKGKLFGVYNKKGQMVVPAEYNTVNILTCGWIFASKYEGNKQSLFNEKGQNIGLPYDRFYPSNNGFSVVMKDSLFGLINMTGEELVPLKYKGYRIKDKGLFFYSDTKEVTYATPSYYITPNEKRKAALGVKEFLPGLYQVSFSHREIGLVNEKRDTVVPPLYKFGAVHQKGYIAASLDEAKWGVIDTKNKTLYPFQADNMGTWTKSGLLPIRYEKEWGLLRFPSAEVVIPFGKYEYIETYDAENEQFIAKQNGKQGIINAKQEVIMPFEYEYISSSSHVTNSLTVGKGKVGFWYRPNGFVHEPVFERVRNLEDSLVLVDSNSTYALMDAKNGKVIIPFSEFYLERKLDYFIGNNSYSLMRKPRPVAIEQVLYDRNGKLLYGPDTVDISVFPDGTFFVRPIFTDTGNESQHRTADGKVLRRLPKNGVEVQDRYWIFSSTNQEGKYVPNTFSYLDPPGKENYLNKKQGSKLNENLFVFRQGKFYGYTDIEGRVIIPFVFDDAEESTDGYLRVKYQGKWGVLQNPKFDYFAQ
ncbi:MAG: WG repeat-containing protein [Saprospiraceae bacterium]|nr:WG repeat-containing protein [Saprospiraceae bacterium]